MEFSYKNDRVTIFIDLATGQIIYKDILKVAISKCKDIAYLKDFQSRFESYVGEHIDVISKNDANDIRQTIKNRISLSENIDEMLRKEKSDMLDNKTASSIRTFKDIVDGKEVSENDNHLLERHINELMGKMHNQTITTEEQMLLDEYVAFKQNADLQNSYSQNVEAMNAAKNADYHKEYPNGKVLKMEPRKNDQTGFVSIVAIFETVILLGILLGAVIITLAFK